jgi:pyruvate dehydrogenase E1 component
VEAAAVILQEQFGISSTLWSITSFNELRRDGLDVDRWNRLHPKEPPRKAYVTQLLDMTNGPVVAATDYMKSFADQIRAWVPHDYAVLGTDGFGRSDTRHNLRRHFEVDRRFISWCALERLYRAGLFDGDKLVEAMHSLGISEDKPDPLYC